MKAGEQVIYVDSHGWEYLATVVAIHGDETVDLEMPGGWGLGRVSIFGLRLVKTEQKVAG